MWQNWRLRRNTLKTQERKKTTKYFQSHFHSHLAADRARTKEGSIWLTMNVVFPTYPDLEWSKIEPFLAPRTPVASCIPTLKAQYKASSSGQGTGTFARSATTTPPPSET